MAKRNVFTSPYSVSSSITRRRNAHKKTVSYEVTRRKRRKVNTEMHDAIVSFGLRDRTSHLSDSEFAYQLIDEISYLAEMSLFSFVGALRAVYLAIRHILLR